MLRLHRLGGVGLNRKRDKGGVRGNTNGKEGQTGMNIVKGVSCGKGFTAQS